MADTDVDQPQRDQAWDERARGETEMERLDRNWSELLQELRVLQTGVQILTGFLLTVPFQQRFVRLSRAERDAYLVAVSLSAAATIVLVAPVMVHRVLFREHARRRLVSIAHRCAVGGAALLGLAVVGVVQLVFDVVAGTAPAVISAIVALVLAAGLWVLLPWTRRPPDGSGSMTTERVDPQDHADPASSPPHPRR